MRPPVMLVQVFSAPGDERRPGDHGHHARRRAPPASRAVRPSLPARLGAATARFVRRDRHSLTDYPCRLPDGKIGRVAVVLEDGEWSLVCRVA